MSESWCVDVIASDNDTTIPRIFCQFLCKILFLTHSALLRLLPDFFPGGEVPEPALTLSTVPDVVSPQRIIFPPGRHLSPYQHTEVHHSLHRTPTPLLPCLPCPLHACRISNASILPPSKSPLTHHSSTSWPLFSANTDPGDSPLPHSMYPCNRPPGLVATSPTPPLLPTACQYMLLVDGLLLS